MRDKENLEKYCNTGEPPWFKQKWTPQTRQVIKL